MMVFIATILLSTVEWKNFLVLFQPMNESMDFFFYCTLVRYEDKKSLFAEILERIRFEANRTYCIILTIIIFSLLI